jgi:murein DD-endopeptidase MepM/ murein hydrolase activator NlpD
VHLRAASVLALVVASVVLGAPSAVADTASELDRARAKVATAQADANGLADEMSAAEGEAQALGERIEQLRRHIEESREEIERLAVIVKARAVEAYSNPAVAQLGILLEVDDPLQLARRAHLLDRANQQDNRDVHRLAALKDDLQAQRDDAEAARAEHQRLLDELATRQVELQDRLADVSRTRDALIVKLEQEKERDAAAAAELVRLQQVKAASAPLSPASVAAPSATATATSPPPVGASPNAPAPTPPPALPPPPPPPAPAPPPVIANPGGGAFQCPVAGSAYSDNYGPRGSGFHNGIDMFAPTGTPLVAVKSGSVSYVPDGGAGGNEAYLAANDGNVYYYAHLSAFVGGPRAVAQGEVIGLVGATGNASGAHLHFEIRVGGVNGSRTNPYPTLVAAGC